MTSSTTQIAPGGMSAQAQKWLAKARKIGAADDANLTLDQQRAQNRQLYHPVSEQAITKHQVTIRNEIIAGVPCLIVDPAKRQENRTILYIFGGAFIRGSAFEDVPISAALAAKTGAQVICPEYRLAPEHPFPAALDDIEAVAKSLMSEERDPLLAGESAGGNLALALIHRLRAQNAPVPKAAALLSPAVDLNDHGETARDDTWCDPTLSPEGSKEIKNLYAAGQDLTNLEISPIYGKFDADFPACFITTGTRDMLLSSCVRLTQTLRNSGANVDLRVWEGMWHVFEFYPEIPESDASLSEIAEFLEKRF
jgi:epsilon-lactone hydrolase